MNVNGVEVLPQGKTFSEIGRILYEASPAQDGLGLMVRLTEEEEKVFEYNFGMMVGYAISDVIADAVKASGKDVKFRYTYSNMVFKTFPQ